jgi:hypothetical protein
VGITTTAKIQHQERAWFTGSSAGAARQRLRG